ncbi:MAG: ribonuclease R [Patescibacteria group bacterium UBA2103]
MKKETTPKKEMQGTITITRKGVGFVDIGEASDLVVRAGETGQALSGDLVKVIEAGYDRGKKAARVLEVLERGQEKYVGRLVEEDGDWLFYADQRKTNMPFLLKEGERKENVKVVFKFTGWNEEKNLPEGNIEEIIGPVGDHEVEMRSLLLREGFAADFPLPVKHEAEELEENGQKLLEAGVAGRKDMRGITTFTIDPVDAKDFDDALSVNDLGDGTYEIGIHIADVSYFVQPGTAIDNEGRKRATSVYLVDRTIPMLPHVLSENLCSLRPNEDRLAMSAIFKLDANGDIKDQWIGETVIHSDKRFAYEEAQDVLDTKNGPHLEELEILMKLSKKIREKRTARGAVSFDRDEVKIEIDENGKAIGAHLKERKDTMLMIEDFMLLANEKVSEHMSKIAKTSDSPRPFIYRIHDRPDEDRIKALNEFIKVLGYSLPMEKDGGITGADLNKLFAEIKDTPEEYLIKTTAVRSMSKAIYSTKNIGHFGLAFHFYSHFTSPIRRYPDLMAHRLIKKCIAGEELTQTEIGRIEEDVLHSTEREISASAAERDSIKLKQVEFMSDKIGTEFDAIITGVIERGIFVEEQETRSEGMISIRTMDDDFYSYEESKYRLIGQNKGKAYQLGDVVRVKLTKANPIERTLDFELVKEEK